VIKYIRSRHIWLIIAAGFLSVVVPAKTQAASWYWGKHPTFERLVISFDTPVKNFTLSRTGSNELTFVTPQHTQAVKVFNPIKNGNRISTAKYLAAPKHGTKKLLIRTKVTSFRYKTSRSSNNKIAIDIYPDSKGKFTPASSQQKSASGKQAPKKAQAAPVAASPKAQQSAASPIKAGSNRNKEKRPFYSPKNVFRSRVNSGGPDNWVAKPSTAEPAQDAPVQPQSVQSAPVAPAKQSRPSNAPVKKVQPSPSATKEPMPPVGNISVPEKKLEKVVSTEKEETEVIWVDKNGNKVAPPPSPSHLLKLAKMALNNGVYDEALESYKELKRVPTLTKKERADVLDGIADTTYAMGKDSLPENYEKIIAATTEAMNFDLKSPKVPSYLLRLGYTNLKIGNVREAGAYFNILRHNHPKDDLVPSTYYYWGEHYFKEKEWQKAADNFQYIVQKYPDTKFVREAGVGLAKSLYQLAYYEQAYQIVDYVKKRWPRFYLDYPPFLSQMGDVAYRLGKPDEARTHYWTYYNIDPDGDDADMVLARLGDIYLETEEFEAAREIYEEAVRKFPDRDGGLVSLMRLAEEGKYDTPTISDMFSVFDKPYSLKPLEIYSKIITEHSESKIAPLARLKKAIWYLWNNQHPEALATASAFKEKYPNHVLIPRVKEVAMRSFSILTANNIKEENYEKILQIWDDFPIVHNQEPQLTPESRVALALSMWKKDKPSKALEILDPFFQNLKVPQYSEMGLSLALSVFVDNEQWNGIIELARRIELWELNKESRDQLDYAVALAYENLNDPEKAVNLWARLKKVEDMPRSKEAYINYFLARDAERREDFELAYKLSLEALRTFKEIAAKDPEKADTSKIRDLLNSLVDITERTGRSDDALEWARELAIAVPEGDPGYPAMRYRIATLYKKTGDTAKWKDILTQLVAADPKSLYGRMATSDLNTYGLSNDASSYSPTGNL
jgi:tetratricopeptide (TPR) repeat protein